MNNVTTILHVHAHTKVANESTLPSQDKTCCVFSLSSPEFTIRLHQMTPLNELLCTSLENTLYIANSLYQKMNDIENKKGIASNLTSGCQAGVLNSSISSFPEWMKANFAQNGLAPKILRLNTSIIDNLLALHPNELR